MLFFDCKIKRYMKQCVYSDTSVAVERFKRRGRKLAPTPNISDSVVS